MADKIHPNLIKRIAGALSHIRQIGQLSERWLEAELLEAIKARRTEFPNEDQRVRKPKFLGLFSKKQGDEVYAGVCADIVRSEVELSLNDIESRLAARLDSPTAIHAIVYFLERNALDRLPVAFDRLADDDFTHLMTAGVYRFAYGRSEGAGRLLDQIMLQDLDGVHELFLKSSGSGNLERRLLVIRADDKMARLNVAEIYRDNTQWRLRSGLIAPQGAVYSVLLSKEEQAGLSQSMISTLIEESDDRAFIEQCLMDSANAYQSPAAHDIHDMAFYTLRLSNGKQLSGAFLDGERLGAVIGQPVEGGRITRDLLEKVAPLGRTEDAELTKAERILVEEMPKLSTSELARSVFSQKS